MHALGCVADRPADGDILITTTTRSHLISVVPHPHRLTFGNLPDAIALARKWASTNRVEIWHMTDGAVVKLLDQPDPPVS
jgi:hypothetical protein